MLGLEADAARNQLRLNPHFPQGLNQVRIHNLRIGRQTVDLIVGRLLPGAPITVQILRNPGGVSVVLP
jgi:hypothetical protein